MQNIYFLKLKHGAICTPHTLPQGHVSIEAILFITFDYKGILNE